MYVQMAFAIDRVKSLADMHPEWRQTQPFKGVLEGDLCVKFLPYGRNRDSSKSSGVRRITREHDRR